MLMNFRNITILILFIFSLLACSTKPPAIASSDKVYNPTQQEAEEAAVGKVGEKKIYEKDLVEGLEAYIVDDSATFKIASQEYLKELMFALEAESQGYASDPDFIDQINTFKKVLSSDFLADTLEINNLIEKSYERLHYEINASHILFPVSPDALPEDTILVYKKALDVRNIALSGGSFDSLAHVFSGDINTRNLGGNMGWFSALQLVYPIEDAAYTYKKGEISLPVRSPAGYHLIRVNDVREFSGIANVSHILIAVNEIPNEELWEFAKNKADSLYYLISNGSDFETICNQYSDDYVTKETGGNLPPFSIGQREEANFEKTVFTLQPGEISKPVKTTIGWHIIRMNSLGQLAPLSKLYDEIKSKVTTDSRGKYLEELRLNKLMQKMNVVENASLINKLKAIADPKILQKAWKSPASFRNSTESLLSISGVPVSNSDFADFAEDRQEFDLSPASYTPEMTLYRYYKIYLNNLVKKSAIDQLENWNPDFRKLMNGYRLNLLSGRLKNDLVYEKSVADTTGQRKFYELHLSEFQIPENADIQIISSKDSSAINEFIEIYNNGKPYRLKRGIYPITFTKNNFELAIEDKRRLAGLIILMMKNPGYLVEIGGHSDVNEVPGISALRMKEVKSYLAENGLKPNRILEVDYKNTKPIDRFDWSKNQRLSIQFFSNDESDISKIINSDNKDLIKYEKLNVQRGENELLDTFAWVKGQYQIKKGSNFHLIFVDKINPSRFKTLKECRSEVINAYQNQLTEQLIERLSVKYPVELNDSILESLYLQNFKK